MMTLVTEHLERRGIGFEVLPHPSAWTALQEARALQVSADDVVKVVMLHVDSGLAVAFIPASCRLDIPAVCDALEATDVRLAGEDELSSLLPEFELGALPALPSLLRFPVVVDPEILDRSSIVFAAGRQGASIRTSPAVLFSGSGLAVASIAARRR